jgi:alanyl-tRNA synthetase
MVSVQEESIDYFVENGYERKRCEKCGRAFWTIDSKRKTCGEPPCDPYSFIGNSPINRRYTLEEMREEFLSFFEERGHFRVRRYPIVARWRDDVYLVNASIYDFQPHVTSGKVPPPGNPLVISQPCIRTVDLDNVGKTGRHLSVFEMGGAKSFNFPGKEVYWKSTAIELAVKFLEHLGVKREEIVFKEKPWAGGGNAGSSVEVMVRGLEVATLVFMDMVEDPEGDTEIDGTIYKKMGNRIVDTGYGIERLTWLSQGTETVYESLYPDMVYELSVEAGVTRPEFLKEFIHFSSMEDGSEEKFLASLPKKERTNLEKLSLIYVLSDHSRAITFLLYDGLVPSNTKAGYVLRMLIRRAILARERLGIRTGLWDLIDIQQNRFSDILDMKLRDSAMEIVKLEEERFRELLQKGDGLIMKNSKGGSIPAEKVITLFESNGLPIEYIRERCSALNIKFPDNLQRNRGFTNVRKEPKKKEKLVEHSYPETQRSYYENERITDFNSRILGIERGSIILENTYFYPEGGGQPADKGVIMDSGNVIAVNDVQLSDGVIVHMTDTAAGARVGDSVHCIVDKDRRDRLMKNHTATHILLSSIREVLGYHIWQAGAQKDPKISRLDVTHYRDVSKEEITRIEERANEIIRLDLPLHKEFVNRNDAEMKYGFTLYQGGIPEGNKLRLVEIPGIDAEGCGGTHVDRTGEVGFIKIVKVEKIQDGIIRFSFAAGKSAVEFVNSQARELAGIKEKMGDEPLNVFESLNSTLEAIKRAIESGYEAAVASFGGREIQLIKVKEAIADEVSKGLVSPGVVLSEEKVRVSSPPNLISARLVIERLEKEGIAKGGGNDSYAQGKLLKGNLSLKELKEAIADKRK